MLLCSKSLHLYVNVKILAHFLYIRPPNVKILAHFLYIVKIDVKKTLAQAYVLIANFGPNFAPCQIATFAV